MKILVGYRGTNVGRDLLSLARNHALAFNSSVIVITSLEGGEKTKGELIADVEQNLETARAFFQDQDIPCETHLLIRGNTPGEDIVMYARDAGVDEIIIGVKSRSKVGKLIFGSTAQYVILQADCPVTTLK